MSALAKSRGALLAGTGFAAGRDEFQTHTDRYTAFVADLAGQTGLASGQVVEALDALDANGLFDKDTLSLPPRLIAAAMQEVRR